MNLDMLLDGVEWRALNPEAIAAREQVFLVDGVPYATHEGVLRIGSADMDVVVLNTGQLLFTEDSLLRFFGGAEA